MTILWKKHFSIQQQDVLISGFRFCFFSTNLTYRTDIIGSSHNVTVDHMCLSPAMSRLCRVLISPPRDLRHILQFDGLFSGIVARSVTRLLAALVADEISMMCAAQVVDYVSGAKSLKKSCANVTGIHAASVAVSFLSHICRSYFFPAAYEVSSITRYIAFH